MNNRPENYGLSFDEVSNTNFANMCFLVVHPQGTLLFEAGLPDRMAGKPMVGTWQWEKFQSAFKRNTLAGQLAEIGYSPANIKYLVLSHFHDDHSGNANLFAPFSTWLVAKPEWEAMFNPADGKLATGYLDFDRLRNAKTVFVTDNYDVFGDGSVRIISTFGHTPGHLALVVKLKNRGNIILSGDLYHYKEEMTFHRMSPYETHPAELKLARAKIEKLAKELKAEIWATHDLDLFNRLTHSPEYHD